MGRRTAALWRDVPSYVITVEGEVDGLLAGHLGDLEVEALGGRTRVTAHVRDEAEMLGVLERLHRLRTSVLALERVGPGGEDTPPA